MINKPIWTIEHNAPNDCWYVKDRFDKILKGFNTYNEAREWLRQHKKDIKTSHNNFKNCS